MENTLKKLKKHATPKELSDISSYLDSPTADLWKKISMTMFAKDTLPMTLLLGITNANLKVKKEFGYPYDSGDLPSSLDIVRGLRWVAALLGKFNRPSSPTSRGGGSPVALVA